VWRPPVIAEDVSHREALYQEGIGDHPPVATPPYRLRAHQAYPLPAFSAKSDQPREVVTEFPALHVVGVPAERGVGPTRVRRVGARSPASAQTRQVRVAYPPLTRQSLAEYRFVELGVTTGGGEAAHVHEIAGSRLPEELEEVLEGPRRVPDGEYEAATIFGLVPTRAFSYDAAPVLANL
jgi:hypothetical protein